MENCWGPFSLDCFASDTNHRVLRFFSRLYSEKATGMNAFAHSWDEEHVWLCPPVSLVVPAVKHLLLSEAFGVLCCPLWVSSSFWHLLAPDATHFAGFVKNFIVFSPKYFSGPSVRSRMFSGVPKWETVALFIDSSDSHLKSSKFSPENCLKNGCVKCT